MNTLGIQAYMPLIRIGDDHPVIHILSDEEICELFLVIDGYSPGTPAATFHRMADEYPVIFRFYYCCGMRNNKACSLKTSDVDLKNGILTIRDGKNPKDRLVYLPEDLRILAEKYFSCLKRMLGFEPVWFFTGRNPVNHISKTQIDKKFDAFWNATPSSKIGIRDQLILVILYDTAIRADELLGLDVTDVTFTCTEPHLRIHGKGDKERIVALSEKTVPLVRQYMGLYHEQHPRKGTPFIYTVIKGQMGRTVGEVPQPTWCLLLSSKIQKFLSTSTSFSQDQQSVNSLQPIDILLKIYYSMFSDRVAETCEARGRRRACGSLLLFTKYIEEP